MNTTSNEIHINPKEMSGTLYKIFKAVNCLDYNDYMMIVSCNENEKAFINEKGLSLSWGGFYLESFLLMKSDFLKWFLYEIDDNKRASLLSYIDKNKGELLSKSN